MACRKTPLGGAKRRGESGIQMNLEDAGCEMGVAETNYLKCMPMPCAVFDIDND
jgi:hypothetical protein